MCVCVCVEETIVEKDKMRKKTNKIQQIDRQIRINSNDKKKQNIFFFIKFETLKRRRKLSHFFPT
mgnify:CR=1 FL=1